MVTRPVWSAPDALCRDLAEAARGDLRDLPALLLEAEFIGLPFERVLHATGWTRAELATRAGRGSQSRR